MAVSRAKETFMADMPVEMNGRWYARSLSEVDREIARQASICNVQVLDPGVIERVLKNDASVCGSANPVAFAKLRNTLMMHYKIRDQAVADIGETATRQLIEAVVDNLRKTIGDRLGGTPASKT